MSRIGDEPIIIPKGVSVSIHDDVFSAKGPKGELFQWYDKNYTDVAVHEDNIVVKSKNVKKANAMQGLYRSLFANIIEGITKGFYKELVIEGVGYKAMVNSKTLVLSVGYSHDINYPIPDGITIETDKKGVNIKISGIDKQLVGSVASKIRSFRKPEPYKGKGIRYSNEIIRRKAGKTAKK